MENQVLNKKPGRLIIVMMALLIIIGLDLTQQAIYTGDNSYKTFLLFDVDPGNCDTLATAWGHNDHRENGQTHIMGGKTWSQTQYFGFDVTDCFANPIPFVSFFMTANLVYQTQGIADIATVYFNHKVEDGGNEYPISEFIHTSFVSDYGRLQGAANFPELDSTYVYTLARYSTDKYLLVNFKTTKIPSFTLKIRNVLSVGSLTSAPGKEQFGEYIYPNEVSFFYNDPTSNMLVWEKFSSLDSSPQRNIQTLTNAGATLSSQVGFNTVTSAKENMFAGGDIKQTGHASGFEYTPVIMQYRPVDGIVKAWKMERVTASMAGDSHHSIDILRVFVSGKDNYNAAYWSTLFQGNVIAVSAARDSSGNLLNDQLQHALLFWGSYLSLNGYGTFEFIHQESCPFGNPNNAQLDIQQPFRVFRIQLDLGIPFYRKMVTVTASYEFWGFVFHAQTSQYTPGQDLEVNENNNKMLVYVQMKLISTGIGTSVIKCAHENLGVGNTMFQRTWQKISYSNALNSWPVFSPTAQPSDYQALNMWAGTGGGAGSNNGEDYTLRFAYIGRAVQSPSTTDSAQLVMIRRAARTTQTSNNVLYPNYVVNTNHNYDTYTNQVNQDMINKDLFPFEPSKYRLRSNRYILIQFTDEILNVVANYEANMRYPNNVAGTSLFLWNEAEFKFVRDTLIDWRGTGAVATNDCSKLAYSTTTPATDEPQYMQNSTWQNPPTSIEEFDPEALFSTTCTSTQAVCDSCPTVSHYYQGSIWNGDALDPVDEQYMNNGLFWDSVTNQYFVKQDDGNLKPLHFGVVKTQGFGNLLSHTAVGAETQTDFQFVMTPEIGFLLDSWSKGYTATEGLYWTKEKNVKANTTYYTELPAYNFYATPFTDTNYNDIQTEKYRIYNPNICSTTRISYSNQPLELYIDRDSPQYYSFNFFDQFACTQPLSGLQFYGWDATTNYVTLLPAYQEKLVTQVDIQSVKLNLWGFQADTNISAVVWTCMYVNEGQFTPDLQSNVFQSYILQDAIKIHVNRELFVYRTIEFEINSNLKLSKSFEEVFPGWINTGTVRLSMDKQNKVPMIQSYLNAPIFVTSTNAITIPYKTIHNLTYIFWAHVDIDQDTTVSTEVTVTYFPNFDDLPFKGIDPNPIEVPDFFKNITINETKEPEKEVKVTPVPDPCLLPDQKFEFAQQKQDAMMECYENNDWKEYTDQLAIEGFSPLCGGSVVTFPGVDMDGINAEELCKKMELSQKENKPPQITFQGVTSKSQLQVKFDKAMMTPKNITDQQFYNSVFELEYQPQDSGAVLSCPFENTNSSEAVEPNKTKTNETLIDFTTQTETKVEVKKQNCSAIVIEHTEYNLQINLTFAYPELVSKSYKLDKLNIHLPDKSLFRSKRDFAPAMLRWTEANSTKLSIQELAYDKAMADSIETASAVLIVAFQDLVTGNFFILMLLGLSLQMMWGAVRVLIMLVFTGLANVKMPFNAFIFRNMMLQVAQIDLFDCAFIFEALMEFEHTVPLNDNYEMLGFETMTFMLNQGSYFTFFISCCFAQFASYQINKWAVGYWKSSTIRKIGMKVYSKQYKFDCMYSLSVLMIESYIDLFLCVSLNIRSIIASKDFNSNFDGVGDILNVVFCFSYFVVLVGLPAFVMYQIRKNYANIKNQKIQGLIGVIVRDIKVNNIQRTLYTFFFMLRRVVLVAALVFLADHNVYQVLTLILLSLGNLTYLCAFKPFVVKMYLYQEIMNEMTVTLNAIILYSFLDLNTDEGLKITMGWVYIGSIAANIFINLALQSKQTFTEVLQNAIDYIKERKRKQQFNQFMQTRNEANRIAHNQFTEFQYVQKRLEATKFVKNWKKHRDWLKANDIKFSGYPDDVLYAKYIKKFDFATEAKYQHLEKIYQNVSAEKTWNLINDKLTDQRNKFVQQRQCKIIQSFEVKDKLKKGILKKFAKFKPKKNSLTTINEMSEADNDLGLSTKDALLDMEKKHAEKVKQIFGQRRDQYLKYLSEMQEVKKIPQSEQKFDIKEETEDDTTRLNQMALVDLRFKKLAQSNENMLKVGNQVSHNIKIQAEKEFALDFLFNTKSNLPDKIKEKINRKLQKKEKPVKEKARRVIPMTNAGPNFYLGGVFQVLTYLRPFQDFLEKVDYDDTTNKFTRKMMELNKKVKANEDINLQDSLQEFTGNEVNFSKPGSAVNAFNYFMNMLYIESGSHLGQRHPFKLDEEGGEGSSLISKTNQFSLELPEAETVEEALEKYFGRQLDQSLNDTTDQLQSNSKHLTGLPEVLAISFNTFDLESRLATSAGQEVDEVIQMAKYVKSDQISERDELSISAVISFEGGTTLGTGSFVTYMYRGSKLYKMGQGTAKEVTAIDPGVRPQMLFYK